ncbi:hypothetical protein L1049_019936 [Liquidambar formosana]|uniref:Uncharacterized protein n=1 Tax=Liquidambar formosana TaxID=63359 RepID=A0AAP0X3A9_LIQFO
MITMKLEIASRETIKPSSPTSHHHETFKLCLLDQLAPPIYVPLVLFYSAADFIGNDAVDHTTISDRLKKSLSKTLSRFYPLCGRMKENASIECNDEGVLYVEARPNVALSDILKNPEISVLEQFLPFDPYRVRLDKEAVITAIQVNVFDCGGIGIGVCILHKIADGATVASFINAWAATASRC